MYERETVVTDSGVLVDHSVVHLDVLAGLLLKISVKKQTYILWSVAQWRSYFLELMHHSKTHEE